ncbi:MAG: HAMP domain-containing protein [Bacteroidales bacterium]|nr:HAMP domain-containing protein [Bacteroidales bacterium]
MKKISIRERLILYFVLLGVISIAIVSLFSIFESKRGIRERAFSQLILLRDIRREQILNFYQVRKTELATLARTPVIRNLADRLEELQESGNFPVGLENDREFLNLVLDNHICKVLYLVSVENNITKISGTDDIFLINKDEDLKVNESIMRLFEGSVTPDTFHMTEWIGESNRPCLILTVPVFSSAGEVSALLLSRIEPEALNNIIFDVVPGTGMGKTGEAYIAGPDGFMRTPSRFLPDAVMTVRINTEGFNKALTGIDSTGIYDDYRGIKVLGAYGKIIFGGFTQLILAEIDVDEAMVPLAIIRNDILIVSSLILLGIFFITWFVAYGITRPIIRLKNAANVIASGSYNQKLKVGPEDEIGELTEAFNRMSEEVSIATRELREKEESLRHFYDATLDGIVLHNDGKMVLFNAAILRLTGYTENELAALVIHDILKETKSLYCDKNQDNEIYETLLSRKDNSSLPVEVQESCVEYKGNKIRASVIRDISTRKSMETELADERMKRLRAVIDGKELEQQRLSRELHDGLGQQLAAGKLILESGLYTEGEKLKGKIVEAQAIFDQIIGDIRRISHDLSPSVLKEFGLKEAVENLCASFRMTTGLRISFFCESDGYQPDEMKAIYLYRIIQECLNNIQRHAGATLVSVFLKADPQGIQLEIKDNGCGFDLKSVPASGGTGLYNIRERVNVMKGQLNIMTGKNKGTVIRIRIPLTTDGQNE